MSFCKKILPIFLVFALFLNVSSAAALSISARGGFVLDSDTGEELFSQNADIPMVPASMTKLMAVYVIYDAMAEGRVSKDTAIPVGAALAKFSRDPGYSNVVLNAGTSYTLDEMLNAIFVVSANAAVMAVGDYLFGSEAAFVEQMNRTVSEWGLDAVFRDCSGISSGNRATPRAMATIANRLVTDYPDCLNYSRKTSVSFRGQTYYATNKMLPGRPYSYDGNVGLKTGTTSAAGACFTGVTRRDGRQLISVVMGAPASNGRYTDTIAMLDYAFGQTGAVPAPEAVQPEPTPQTPVPPVVFVNDRPIVSYVSGSESGVQMIRVEDLRSYGFSVLYEPDTNTLVVTNDPSAPVTGLDTSGFTGEKPVRNTKAVNVLLKQSEADLGIYAGAVYDAEGMAAIDVQELSYLGWVLQKNGMAAVVTR